MPSYINKAALYDKAVNLEAKAMIQLDKLTKIPFGEMTQNEYIAWRVWSAVYQERTAFKHDVFDEPDVDVVERKVSKWIDEPVYRQTMDGKTWDGYTYCSLCKEMHEYKYRSNFCSYCGARMKGEDCE